MDEELTKRILKEKMMADAAKDRAEKAAKVFDVAAIRGSDEEGFVVGRIEQLGHPHPGGPDDDGLVVGRVTFSPEVERIRKGMASGGVVRKEPETDWLGKYRGPLNHPKFDRDAVKKIIAKIKAGADEPVYLDPDDLDEDDVHSTGSAPPPTGVDNAAHPGGGNQSAKDSRTMVERAAYVPPPPPPEGTPAHRKIKMPSPYMPKTQETLGDGLDGGGKRMNAGKLRVDLVPPEWLFALADVMTQGSRKYEPRNWEKGMKWSTMIGSMKRHLAKFEAGEMYDGLEFDIEKGTTGCHHLAMIAWNALGLMSYNLRRIGTNDLPDDDGLKLFDRVNAMTTDLEGNSIHD